MKTHNIKTKLFSYHSNEEDVGKTDRVIQTDTENIERDVDKADRVVQTDPTNLNGEEKTEASSDDRMEWIQLSKKPTVESIELIMKNLKTKSNVRK